MADRLLIVDDHAGFRSLAGELLHGSSFQVVGAAADEPGARRMTHALQPDVILLDVQLAEGLAFDLAAELAAHGTIVVLTSTRSAADYGSRVRDCGAAGFINKAQLSGERLSGLVAERRGTAPR